MLVDEIDLIVEAGKGGAGKVSFVGRAGGPDGGDGGRGGDVFVTVTSNLYALNQFTSGASYAAEDGKPGGPVQKSGEDGKDRTIIVPIGTFIIDGEGKELEMNSLNQRELLAKGGLGGHGNEYFKSSTRTTPKFAQPGLIGQKKKLILRLKLIADFGLIGLPNAGKSSLLNELTNANAKIGDYPFTTLEPNLGMLQGKVIADIPGLIEGAAEGRGLGHKFLKHIEKVSLLLHCISSESEDPIKDYNIIHQELEKFNPELLNKKEIILLTKTDQIDKDDLEKKIKILKRLKIDIIPVSIHDFDSLKSLIQLFLN